MSAAGHASISGPPSALLAGIREVRAALLRYVKTLQEPDAEPAAPAPAAPSPADTPTSREAQAGRDPVAELSQRCGLSPFERHLLLLLAAIELDSETAELCAQAQGSGRQGYVNFALALATLPNPHLSALLPAGPLRRFRLLHLLSDLDGFGSLTRTPLRIEERVLHQLTGQVYLDEGLAELLQSVPPPPFPAPAPPRAPMLAFLRAPGSDPGRLSLDANVLHLCGDDRRSAIELVADVAHTLGARAYRLRAADVPAGPGERRRLCQLWERETRLSDAVLVLQIEEGDPVEPARALAEQLTAPLIIARREALALALAPTRRTLRLDVNRPDAALQDTLWQRSLAGQPTVTEALRHRLAGAFHFTATEIAEIATDAKEGQLPSAEPASESLDSRLWRLCRQRSRPVLDELAQRIEPRASFDDLVLPRALLRMLRHMAAHLHQRLRVHHDWGFAEKTSRGLGTSALFTGPSGTGKTMAAEVLARELGLDLYRIDLSQVVSKYIGETEKNLRRIFDAADTGGAILLFDEADALFGRRSEVKDSHDRYANLEVSYLLQRIEAYRGLGILTSNLRQSVDTAFLRRLRFILAFPFPDLEHRRAIWQRAFPERTPLAGLDFDRIAQLSVSGGVINNIAMGAAFLAAEQRQSVSMRHIYDAACSEFEKLERSLSELDFLWEAA